MINGNLKGFNNDERCVWRTLERMAVDGIAGPVYLNKFATLAKMKPEKAKWCIEHMLERGVISLRGARGARSLTIELVGEGGSDQRLSHDELLDLMRDEIRAGVVADDIFEFSTPTFAAEHHIAPSTASEFLRNLINAGEVQAMGFTPFGKARYRLHRSTELLNATPQQPSSSLQSDGHLATPHVYLTTTQANPAMRVVITAVQQGKPRFVFEQAMGCDAMGQAQWFPCECNSALAQIMSEMILQQADVFPFLTQEAR